MKLKSVHEEQCLQTMNTNTKHGNTSSDQIGKFIFKMICVKFKLEVLSFLLSSSS